MLLILLKISRNFKKFFANVTVLKKKMVCDCQVSRGGKSKIKHEFCVLVKADN